MGGIFCVRTNSSSDATWQGAAMQVREYNYVGCSDGTDTWARAPRLAWHWACKTVSQLGLASNGRLYEAPYNGTTFYKNVIEDGGSYNIQVPWSNVTGGTNSGNRFTISGTTGDMNPLLFIQSTSNGSWNYLMSLLSPNLTAGYNNAMFIGKAYSTYNSFGLTYRHAGDGSSSNALAIHCWGAGDVVNFSGNMSTTFSGAVYSNSDRHLKKNISSIPASSLERLFGISDKLLKRFTWKQSNKASYGFIAQELEQYIPEAVSVNTTTKVKSVSYDIVYAKIIASIIHEIKKLKDLIEDDK